MSGVVIHPTIGTVAMGDNTSLRKPPELLTEEERKEILAEAELLWKDLQENKLGGFSDGNRTFYILHVLKWTIEKYGRRDVGLTWSKNELDTLSTRPAQEPVAWVIPGQDTARADGFLDAMAWQEGEFSRPLYAAPQPVLSQPEVKAETRIIELEGKLAEAIDTLKFYANPEIYKPHPHGLAFDQRDLSFSATSTLSTLIGGEA